jgi:predicted ATPase/DNA-binding SARP family transcriptional activator
MAVLTTGRLPVRLTPLVGRETELGEVTGALAHCRLLTLTGPGGTGKTRLALAAAARLTAEEAPYGDVAWVELAPISDPRVIAPTIVSRLGIPETPGMDPVGAIVARLTAQRGPGRVLLVLDNCEHLTAELAGLAEHLLAECPSLSILATSREPLGVEGELAWPVPPLGGAEAAKLFEDRARLVAPSFGVTEANKATIAEVCERLDGLPLAIELAAARLRVLSVKQLARRLDDVFGVLTGGTRSAPPRHQALRATLDWSYALLTGQERAVFRRLAVFSGGFTLPAAERVTAFNGIGRDQVLNLLTRLTDKSLIKTDNDRYQLLATIREYAAEKVDQAGEGERVRQAHLAYYTEFAQEAGDLVEHATAGELEEALDHLDAERDNLRTATRYAWSTDDAVAALRIVGELGRYAYLRGHYREVREWMDQAVAIGHAAPSGYRARALYGSGRLAQLQCDYEAAVLRLDAALTLYRELADSAGIASCLQALGSVAREQGRYDQSAELHAESLALAEAAGDAWAAASAHSYLGFVSWLRGDLDRAVTECTRALAMFRALADVEGTAWSLISLGVAARYRNDARAAAALLGESLELSRSIGFREGIAWCEEQLGLVALDQGDVRGAAARLRSSYAMHRDLRDRWRMASVLEDLAGVTPDPEQAAWLLGLAQATREAIGTVIAPCERPQHERSVAAASAALGRAAYEAAWRRGAAASDPDEFVPERPRPSPPPGQGREPEAPALPSGPAVLTSPLSGVTPILAGPSFASPLTGASAIFPETPARPATPQTASAGPGGTPPRPAGQAAAPVRRPPARPAAAARPAGPLRIRALGQATVELGGTALTAADWGYAKPRELLFLLITSPPQTREQLGAALWPELSRAQLRNALHTALRELRRALGDPGWIVYGGGQYSVDRTRAFDCDVDEFESSLAAAGRARPASAGLADLRRAVAAYGGDFLAGMSAGEWAATRRDELRRRFETALLATGRLHMAAGNHQAAVTAFRRAVEHEPLNESAHRELMTCWAQLGETARAVRHYTELTILLRDTVGVPPAAETTALYERLSGRG